MTTVTLSLFAGAGAQFLDNSGNVLTGGLIYTYAAGTTTPLATYTSNLGNTAHSNPIVLDASGRVATGEIWLAVGFGYKFVVKDANNVLIGTYDNIPSSAQPPIVNDASSIAYEQGYTVTAGAFVVGSTYLITSVGTTNFQAIGATSNTVGVLFIATGVGSGTGTAQLSRTVQSKLQESISVLDFGADPTGIKDSLAAFNAAIASFSNNATSSPYSGGNTILVPQGTYTLSGQLNISRQIILRGVTTPDGNAWSGSILKFPTGTTGIRIYDYRTSPLGTDAGGTTIENLVIRTTRTSAATQSGYHGIHADTRFTVRNCVITYFGDCGINIIATAGGSPNGNANNWRIDNVRSAENGVDGLFIDGADVNAGVAIRLDCSSNLRYGIFDSSFLGNTYIGCHTAGNGSAAYKTDNINARNVLLGCYSESGQPASELIAPTLVLGGLHGADFSAGTTAQLLSDNGLKAGSGNVASPSLSFNTDKTSGFYPQGTATGQFNWASLGVLRGRFGNGWIKTTTDGTFYNSAGVYNEAVQSSTTLGSSYDYLKSTSYTGLGKVIICETTASTGFNLLTGVSSSNVTTFQVLGNGNVQNTNNSYGAISDIKYKQDITDISSQWSDIKNIRLRKYRFKSEPTEPLQIGVIAQELESTSPGLVMETPDRDNNGELTGETSKGVKYSILFLKAVGALQEAMERIEKLEAKITALELKSTP